MGTVDINWLAVILAAIVSSGIGWLWHSEYLFRDRWRRLAGLTLERQEQGVIPALAVTAVGSLLSAYVIAWVASLIEAYSNDGDMASALGAAFWLWLGIAATSIIVADAFEQRPVQMTALSVGHRLAAFLAMGLIIGLFGV